MKLFGTLLTSLFLLFSCNQAQNMKTEESGSTKSVEKIQTLNSDTIFTFDNYEIDKIPEGWSQYFIGSGSTEWKVVDDNGNKVLAQLASRNPGYHFNEIAFNGFAVKNVELQVKLKGVSGEKDQGGGFIWRFIDGNNYYVVRANPLEDNVVLYKVVDGDRTDLPLIGEGRTYGVDVKPLGNNWNTLKLKVVDNLFTVYLNGEELFKVKDDTFKNAGKIGLWTKADAVTYFDDYQIKPIR
jgi:hypothetical protein